MEMVLGELLVAGPAYLKRLEGWESVKPVVGLCDATRHINRAMWRPRPMDSGPLVVNTTGQLECVRGARHFCIHRSMPIIDGNAAGGVKH